MRHYVVAVLEFLARDCCIAQDATNADNCNPTLRSSLLARVSRSSRRMWDLPLVEFFNSAASGSIRTSGISTSERTTTTKCLWVADDVLRRQKGNGDRGILLRSAFARSKSARYFQPWTFVQVIFRRVRRRSVYFPYLPLNQSATHPARSGAREG